MIVSSIVLVLVSCMTFVIGIRQSSTRDVCISIACTLVSGAILVKSIKGRSAVFSEGPEAPPFLPDEPVGFGIVDATVACSLNGSPAAATWASGCYATGPDATGLDATGLDATGNAVSMPPPAPVQILPLAPPPTGVPAIEAALDLQAPGPGALGRIRRRPLAGSEGLRPPLTVRAPDPGSGSRRSGAEACGTARRSKSDSLSASAVPGKAAAGRRTAAEASPLAPAAPSSSRSRASGKPGAGKAAGTTRPSGVRPASRNGTGADKQAVRKATAATV